MANENVIMCVECRSNEAWSRGLCSTCYKIVSRSGFLSDYPTKAFLNDPESHARWLYSLGDVGFELLQDIGVEFGYRVLSAEDYRRLLENQKA